MPTRAPSACSLTSVCTAVGPSLGPLFVDPTRLWRRHPPADERGSSQHRLYAALAALNDAAAADGADGHAVSHALLASPLAASGSWTEERPGLHALARQC